MTAHPHDSTARKRRWPLISSITIITPHNGAQRTQQKSKENPRPEASAYGTTLHSNFDDIVLCVSGPVARHYSIAQMQTLCSRTFVRLRVWDDWE
jgi:hypothetical protein